MVAQLTKAKIQEAPLRLVPKIAPYVQNVLRDTMLLFDLVEGLGSPLNLVFPELLKFNLEAFQSVFQKNSIRGKVFFAHKCNQSNSFVRQFALEDCGIDVSSTRELQHSLQNGFIGQRIEATGPKSIEFLSLAIQHGVTINVDSLVELKQIISLGASIRQHLPIQILLRLAGFSSEHSRFLNKDSRFGIPVSQLEEALTEIEQQVMVDLIGFSFHLNSISMLEKAVAIENCFAAFETAINRGLSPSVLNIGGGYKVNYLANGDDWNNYTSALKEAALGKREPLTWHGASFGLHADNGVLKGNLNSYNFFDEQTGGDYLHDLINQRLPEMGNITVASFLRDNMIELWIEPGRALVDQCGITLAKVNGTTVSSGNDQMINLAMKRQDISFLDQEIFVDPVLIPRNYGNCKCGASVFFTGNMCLESDLIFRHKTFIDQIPLIGDLVAFVNTAGYFMDFSATQSIMQPFARKVSVTTRRGRLRWCLDECYHPFKDEPSHAY